MEDDRLIGVRSPEFREIQERIKVATRLSTKLSAFSYEETESIRQAFEELIGKPVGDSFYLIPPFYTDYGLNITVGRASSSATNARSRAMQRSRSPTRS
jgi:hypothetical protein